MNRTKCDTPYCDNEFFVRELEFADREYIFCANCRETHSTTALITQVEHGKQVNQVILDSRMFKTANGMSAYIGVSFVTLYHWIGKYFNLTFQEFRRTYICESSNCYLLNIERSSYSRSDYLLRKIRSRRYCACINALQPGHIMTKAPIAVVANLLKNKPRLDKLTDRIFMIAPVPVKLGPIKPYYNKIINPFYYNYIIPFYTNLSLIQH